MQVPEFAYQVSEWLIKVSKNSETKVLVLLMLAVAGLGAFMSSTGIEAFYSCGVGDLSADEYFLPKR